MTSKIKLLILLFIVHITGWKAFAQQTPYHLLTSTGEIKGTLSLPEKDEAVPLVLIIAGSGPTDRDGNNMAMKNNSNRLLAEGLMQQGIASVRFDKRGIAESQTAGIKESDLRFEHYVDDVRSWVDTLSKDKRFSKIIIAGHSEGSLIGMISAGKSPRVSAFISIAGVGRPADEVIKEQLEAQPQAIKDMVFPMLDKIKGGDTVANVSPMLYSLLRPSVQPYMISWFKYDPAKELAALKIPVLIIQGTTDIQVKEKDADLLASALPSAQKVIIPDMNHVLKTISSTEVAAQMPVYNNPDLPLSDALLPAVVHFIKALK